MKRLAIIAANVALAPVLASGAPAQAAEEGPTPGGGLGGAKMKADDLVVSDVNAFGGDGGLIKVDRVTGVRETISENAAPVGFPEFRTPRFIAIERDGDILVAGQFSLGGATTYGGVIRVDPATGVRSTVSLTSAAGSVPPVGPVFGNPLSVAVEPTGDILVLDALNQAIYRVDPATGNRSALTTPGPLGGPAFVTPEDIEVDASGDIFVTDDQAVIVGCCRGAVFRVDPSTGVRSILADNTGGGSSLFNFPLGFGLNLTGDPLVGNAGGAVNAPTGILKVQAATGTRSTVTSNTAPAGAPTFTLPEDVVVKTGGKAYATNNPGITAIVPGVLSVKRSTGVRATVSDNNAPPGAPLFSYPWGIQLYPIVFTKVAVSPGKFGPEGLAPRVTRSRGTTFSYKMSERARLVVTLARQTRGRLVDGRCGEERSGNRRRRACTRYVRVGRLVQEGRAGSNRLHFSGRVAGRALPIGRYRATLLATSSGGHRSRPVSLAFRVVK